ncbi:MAG TPA: tetratricopeptide repeat protein, partial [bacterium]|nr:tetratricopeptide repeat protein [bacterium]
GKGANLAEMSRIGLPVPPGFTITTEVCTYYYANRRTYPKVLDAQVKANLLFSYDKRTEPFESVAERIEALRRQHPQDPDLAKALAFVLTAQQDHARAAELIESIPDKNDPELFFLLGLIAKARKDLQNAESLFSSGYIASQTKSNKLAFAIAELKMMQGDVDGAVAFLNRIISASPYYIKAYLKKAEALAYEKKNIGDAITFLASIDANVLSQADETEKAVYYALLGDMHYRNGATAEAIESYLRVVALDKENIRYLADLAKIYQETKQSSAALDYYEKALAVDNRYIPAIIGKAEVFIRLKRYNDAFLEIAKIDITNLNDANQLLRLANLFHQQGEREKAMQLYERAITADPSLIDAYLGRVFLYLEMNMYDEIRKLLASIGELNRESHSYYLIQGILNHRDGNYKKAEESFRKSLELNRSEDPRVFLFYGRFLYDRQNFPQASEYFAKAVKISPDDPEYRVALARSLEKEKKYQDMLPLLDPVEGNQKVHAQAFQLRAEALMQTGDLDNALKLIDRAIAIDAKNAYFFYKKADILFHREEMNPAISVIETALLLDINSFESYVLFSKILLKKGDFKTAVEKLEEAARIDATSQQVYLLKGILLKNLDNYPEALRNFRKIRNNPELEKEALLEIAECYLNLEKTDEALKYFSKALKAGNKTALRFLGRIYYDKGKLDKAAEYYRQSLKVFPDDHEPLKQLGYIFKERGRHTTARSYFKRYIKFLRAGDPERAMIEDEIYYSEKNIGTKKLSKIKKEEAEEESVGDDEFGEDAEGKTEEAKKLYMEAVSLAEADKKEAKRILRKVMKTVPANDKYHIKARKLLKKIQEDEEEY